jgi:hypothetical protein
MYLLVMLGLNHQQQQQRTKTPTTTHHRWKSVQAVVAYFMLFGLISLGVLFFPLALLFAFINVPTILLARPPPISMKTSETIQWIMSVCLIGLTWVPFLLNRFGQDVFQGEFWGDTSSSPLTPYEKLLYGRDHFSLIHWYFIFGVIFPSQFVVIGILVGVFGV